MTDTSKLTPLNWHYGPILLSTDPGRMWCYDCSCEVLGFKEGLICSGCGREEPAPPTATEEPHA